MEYSPEFKKNFATAYLAEEYERLEKEAADALEAAGTDAELIRLAKEDETRVRAREAEILSEIERILAKEKEVEARPRSVVLELRAGTGGDEAAILLGI
jgi:Protein chain release factor A